MSKALALVLGLVLVSPPAHAAGIDATCNMFVPPGQTATLSSDLSCNLGGVAIYLDAKSILDLNGFTLTVAEDMTAVFCQHVSCSVISSATGPGVLEGNFEAYYGLISNLQQDERPVIRKLVIDNVIIQNFENAGMYGSFFGKSYLSRLTVTGNGGPGIIGTKMSSATSRRSP